MNRKINAKLSRDVFKVDSKYTKAPSKIFSWSFTIVILFMLIFGFSFLKQNWIEFFSSFDLFFDRVKDLASWDFKEFSRVNEYTGLSFFNLAFESIWVTIGMAFSGTIIGVTVAIPVAIMASSNIVHNKFLNSFARGLSAVFRTIPAFTFALVLVGYFGKTTFTVTIALSIFTFAITTKMLFEKIEHINTKIFISMQSTGATKLRSFRAGVVPQISNHVVSTTFYSLETNIRYISVIGGVTSTGIGSLIDKYVSQNEYNKVGFLLFLLILTVLILELIIYLIRKYIIFDADYFLDKKQQKKFKNELNKRISKNNLRFYINEVVLKEWNVKYKNTSKNNKAEIQNLKIEKKELVNNFLNEHKSKLNEDKIKFEEFKKDHINSKSWFVFDNVLLTNVRMDKIYLTEFNTKVLQLKTNLKNEYTNNAKMAHNQFVENLTVQTIIKKNPRQYLKRIALYLIIFAMFCYSASLIRLEWQNPQTIQATNDNLAAMFDINWASFFTNAGKAPYSVISLLFETLSIAIVSTFIGAIIAYILGLLSSENVVNFYVAKFFVAITTILRAIPTYIYAILFISFVGMGPFTAVLAIIMGTIGMLTKYNREIFDDINLKLVSQLQATGLNAAQRFKYGIMTQTSSNIFSYIIYRFDINFKEVITLGAVGAGNMGYLLNSYFSQQYYSEFGALLLGIIIFTLIIENITTNIRIKLNTGANPVWIDKIILLIRHSKFSTFKANELIFNKKTGLSYYESSAFYSYINLELLNLAKEIKAEEEISFNEAYYKAYCKYLNLEVKDNNYKEAYLNNLLIFKEKVNEYKEKRKKFVEEIKLKKVNSKIELKKKKEEFVKSKKLRSEISVYNLELKKVLKFNSQSSKIKINSLDY